jgi:predicted P-loop ATPase
MRSKTIELLVRDLITQIAKEVATCVIAHQRDTETPHESHKRVTEARSQYEIADQWEGAIAAWLETTPIEGFTTSDVLTHAINVPIERHGRRESTRVGTILKQLGYESRQFRVGGKRQRGYFPSSVGDVDW